ncbi:MAG: TonB-dependent receptor [Paludibacter sp.]|nr:TonB-dependent receptor [Paludibacter sp.]
MRFKFILFMLAIFASTTFAQNTIKITVKDKDTKEALPGVTVILKDKATGGATDSIGNVELSNIPNGEQEFTCSMIGYKTNNLELKFPLKANDAITVYLDQSTEDLDEVTVTSVRTNSRIESIPTRVEVLGTEDINEENGIMPGNLLGIVGDVAGIQMQQVSASSGNTYARIQGLNGRYTQLLKDGMPLYGGLSGSFSLMQTPPLDLKQIEIIKGSCSTLYGGDAIAGIINLVSKEPSLQQDASATVNETSLGETNLNAFTSKRYKTFGYTLFAGQTWRKATDINNDGLSDASKIGSTVIHPRLQFYFSPKTTLTVDYSGTFDNRTGGDMRYFSTANDSLYHVQIQSSRNSASARLVDNISENSNLTVKVSGSNVQQTIGTKWYDFKAAQSLFYSEVSYFRQLKNMNWVAGMNVNGDNFSNLSPQIPLDSYFNQTIGAFVQNTYNPTAALTIESGFRADYQPKYGWFPLPRLSVMYKFSNEITARINGGLGYKAPIPVNYLDPEVDLNHLASVNGLRPEHSQGINADFNYQKGFGETNITLNQSFFASSISSPIDSLPNQSKIVLYNANKPVVTYGAQTYSRIKIDELEIYLSYVYTEIKKLYQANQTPVCTPKHEISNTNIYEMNKHWVFGLENSLIAGQLDQNYHNVPAYYILAAMVQYKTGHFSIVLNGENLLDVRQSRYEKLFDGTIDNPQFHQFWAPIEGRIVNLSVTWKI